MISLMMKRTRTDRGGDFALYPPLPKGNVAPNIEEFRIAKYAIGQFAVFEMYDGDDTVAMFNMCTIVTNRLDEKDDRQTINHVSKRSIAVRQSSVLVAMQQSFADSEATFMQQCSTTCKRSIAVRGKVQAAAQQRNDNNNISR